MPSNWSGILGVLAMVLALVQVPNGPISSTTPRNSPHLHAPMRLHRLRPNGTVESENWSGYAVTGSSFTQALGSWIVPTVDCSVTPNTYSAFWVGLDGYSSSTVEQIGTEADCNGTTPSYYAWYEFYPKFPVINILPIKPNDRISAEVSYNGKEFTVAITDETTGKVVQHER